MDIGVRARQAVVLSATLVCGICVAFAQDKQPAPSAPASLPKTEAVKVDLKAFPQGWSFYTAEPNASIDQTWKVVSLPDNQEEAVLQCLGEPFGYLRTTKSYKDFEVSLEWKFPKDANGNSGILIHTANENKIWPKSIQIQLHGPTTGSIFPIGDAKSENNVQLKGQMPAPNQWHRCLIRAESGKVSVTINDKLVGEITGCSPEAGSISLQSEGSEIHFRKIEIRELNPTAGSGAGQDPKESPGKS